MSKPHSKKSIKKTDSRFPSISRFITEKRLFFVKLSVFSFVTTILLIAIILQLLQLRQGLEAIQTNNSKHQSLIAQKAYWQDVITHHSGYRDATFRLAVLSFRLGLKSEAATDIKTTLQIDPNFTPARVFAQKVGL